MASSGSSVWTKLKFLMDKDYAIPTAINAKEIITSRRDAVVVYDVAQNSWTDMFKYPQWLKMSIPDRAIDSLLILNQTQKTMYLIVECTGKKGFFIIDINLKTTQCTQKHHIKAAEQNFISSVLIGEKVHIFAMSDTAFRHILFDAKLNQHTDIDTSHISNHITNAYLGSLFLKSKKMILLIGARRFFTYSFESEKPKWSLLNVEYPEDFICILGQDQCGYVLSNDELFVIIFSSWGPIWIFDLIKMEIRRSRIDCPFMADITDYDDADYYHSRSNVGYKYHATLGPRNKRDEIASGGYIRVLWKDKSMKGIKELPVCLIKSIQKYFCDTDIHLFESGRQQDETLEDKNESNIV